MLSLAEEAVQSVMEYGARVGRYWRWTRWLVGERVLMLNRDFEAF